MNDLAAKLTDWAFRNATARATLFGVLMGWVTWEMSRSPEHAGFRLSMALVMLACGSVSFVLHALHLLDASGRPGRMERLVQVRRCGSALGCGVLLSLAGLQVLFG